MHDCQKGVHIKYMDYIDSERHECINPQLSPKRGQYEKSASFLGSSVSEIDILHIRINPLVILY